MSSNGHRHGIVPLVERRHCRASLGHRFRAPRALKGSGTKGSGIKGSGTKGSGISGEVG
jgi:hypothetical protein